MIQCPNRQTKASLTEWLFGAPLGVVPASVLVGLPLAVVSMTQSFGDMVLLFCTIIGGVLFLTYDWLGYLYER
ncbi:hypothetical protein N825_29870 [Skermanella stibiiresistens SB22]|uniref:Uncharacterized protein n=1 Tax=Skermanella stibiiresistens SB22 TaxID=1385369 RepID=W9GUR6_9PROT|nr:hypothetical protein N825_29870 [Skermanella stibiiresistens SB22]